jgi:transposase
MGREAHAPRSRGRSVIELYNTLRPLSSLGARGVVAPRALDRPINGDAFETYVRRVLVPELKRGDIVVKDNLSSHKSSHKRPEVRALIEAAGARALCLPPDSPHFNPIEKAFAKLKALRRKAEERTVEGLWRAIGRLVDLITHAKALKLPGRCRLIGFRSNTKILRGNHQPTQLPGGCIKRLCVANETR